MSDERNELDDSKLSLLNRGISRRDFMKYCGMLAATLGLEASFIPKIAHALESGLRPPVIWLHFAECTGCTESFIRHPAINDLILQSLSIEYHETLMAPSGAGAHKSLADAVSKYNGEFICICEGSIPTAKNGIYGMIGNKTMLQIAREICPKAKAVISYGTCASYGGLAAGAGGVTGAKSVHKALGGFPTINIPGCSPNPYTLVATIVSYLLNGTFPSLDSGGRPAFASRSPHPCDHYLVDCFEGTNLCGNQFTACCRPADPNDPGNWPCTFNNANAFCIGCSKPTFLA